jgi:hypothetical protein
MMTTIEVTSRQLKKEPLTYWNLLLKGTPLVVNKGKKLFNIALTPVKQEESEGVTDPFFTPEMLSRIEESRQQAREGKVTICRTKEESIRHLESL